MNAIHLISRTEGTVTMSAADYEALMTAAEDAGGVRSLRAAEAREVEMGIAAARADNPSDDLVGRLLDGEHPITIWREHRGLPISALAEKAGVSRICLAEIETKRKPGSIQAFRSVAGAPGVTVDDLPFESE